MLSLEDIQANIVSTINTGPDVLDPALFAGPSDRILLGLKAHANTISHARLVALEAGFPLSRNALGEAAFNALSRKYVESVFARARDNNRICGGFAAFLRGAGTDPSTCELAQIEWAYLNSYHAPDATALRLTDLAAMNEAALLAHTIALHPAAQIVSLSAAISPSLEKLAGQTPAAILLVRPEVEVLLYPIGTLQHALLMAAEQKFASLGNLLAIAVEHGGEAVQLDPVSHLINVGALISTG